MTATTTPPPTIGRTRTGAPKLGRLDRQAVQAAAEQAAHAIAAKLAADHGNPEKAAVNAAQAADMYTNAADLARTERDRAALSFALHHGARAVHEAIGVARNRFYTMRRQALGLDDSTWLITATPDDVAALATARHIPKLPDDAETARRMIDDARSVIINETIAAACRKIRDEHARHMVAAGHSRGQVAHTLGVSRSLMSSIAAQVQ